MIASPAASPAITTNDAPARARAGIGLRQPHYAQVLNDKPALGFVEVHSENFFADGGAALTVLREARSLYPVSLHGVGLALGSAAGLDPWHLDRLERLVQRIEPARVSDHASFARAPLAAGHAPLHANDLLPIAFTDAALEIMVANVAQVQERLRRPILVENLSAYVSFDGELAEPQFFAELCRRSGCGMLLDVNNLVVNALNRQEADPVASCKAFVDALPDDGMVGEIHLAGYDASGDIVIDDHGSRVRPEVWALYDHALRRFGAVPTLVEWDTNVPAFEVLLGEARRADMRGLVPSPRATKGPLRGPSTKGSLRGPSTRGPLRSPGRGSDAEAGRQRALLAAILAPRGDVAPVGLQETGERAARGLCAYRANAEALADRALASTYPSIRAMLGDEDFAHLAAEFWRTRPPQRGDVGEWGADFAAWLEAHPAMSTWPYLADCARLDLVVQRNERAADAEFDAGSLALLGSADPADLRLELMPGTALVSSRWPIVTIHRAHRSSADADFAAAREAIDHERGEHALVCRDGWRADVTELEAAGARWTRHLLDGATSLAAALGAMESTSFDFAAWLAQAVQRRWLKRVVRRGDR